MKPETFNVIACSTIASIVVGTLVYVFVTSEVPLKSLWDDLLIGLLPFAVIFGLSLLSDGT